MFIGHYGIALGAKALFPDAPLPMLMLSTQMIDVVFAGLVLAKVERVEIDVTATPTVPLRLTYMPFSHGLLGALAISVLMAGLTVLLYPETPAIIAYVIGLVCFSHWLLDLIVHDRDMPLIANRHHVGFGLWHNRTASIALEYGVIILGAAMLSLWGAVPIWKLGIITVVMCGIQAISFFTAPPKKPAELAVTMLAVFAAMTAAGWWMEN
jgi:hypothetical protein